VSPSSTPGFSVNAAGAIAAVGAPLLTCPPDAAGCIGALAGTEPGRNNNDFAMRGDATDIVIDATDIVIDATDIVIDDLVPLVDPSPTMTTAPISAVAPETTEAPETTVLVATRPPTEPTTTLAPSITTPPATTTPPMVLTSSTVSTLPDTGGDGPETITVASDVGSLRVTPAAVPTPEGVLPNTGSNRVGRLMAAAALSLVMGVLVLGVSHARRRTTF